jgi:DNA polymerase I-like protein with 3'-5' exonuclease and polymerase domains
MDAQVMKIPDDILDLNVCISWDLSQAEIRMLAELSGDELLIAQLLSGEDIHSLVGHELTGWPVERIKSDKMTRKVVKNTIFSVVYGVARDGLHPYIVAKIREVDGTDADVSMVTVALCNKLYDAFFRKYSGVRRFLDLCIAQGDEQGFVETMFGFKREIRKSDEKRQTFWKNQSQNTPIQGSAHTLILIALALLHLKPRTYSLLRKPVMEVHDALYFFVKLRDLPEAFKQGMALLQTDVIQYAERHWKRKIRVPFTAEASAGFCLGSLVDYKGEPVAQFLPLWQAKHREVEAKGWDKLQNRIVSV